MIDRIDILIQDWADFNIDCFQRSPIGYPKASPEGRAGEGGSSVAGSMCPEVIMRERVAKLDRIYKDEHFPNKWKKIIQKKYIDNEKLTRREYQILDPMHHFIDGRMKAGGVISDAEKRVLAISYFKDIINDLKPSEAETAKNLLVACSGKIN